jgi:hypothetical protein
MPEKRAMEKAHKTKRARKTPPTKAGEFIRGEIHKMRRGEHGARSPQPREPRSTASRAARSRVRAAAQRTASPMPRLDYYRQNAFDCVQMARRVGDRQNKAILVLIAHAWVKLGEQNATLRNERAAREADAATPRT